MNWTRVRAWLAEAGIRLRKKDKPACDCTTCISPSGRRRRRYTCRACRRFVPWCFGASDVVPEVCDDCYQPTVKAICALYPEEA